MIDLEARAISVVLLVRRRGLVFHAGSACSPCLVAVPRGEQRPSRGDARRAGCGASGDPRSTMERVWERI
jgi:hypothetical protein